MRKFRVRLDRSGLGSSGSPQIDPAGKPTITTHLLPREEHGESDFSTEAKHDFLKTMIQDYGHIIWDWNGTLLDDLSLKKADL